MLYDQIRYAEEARVFYRLRGRSEDTVASSIVQGLGYAKYSNQFYKVKKRLKEEAVLDGKGRFIETPPNTWLAELPQIVGEKEREVLGYKVSNTLFLAVLLSRSRRIGELGEKLGLSRRSVYAATQRLIQAELLRKGGPFVSILETPAKKWLSKYLDVSKTLADISGNISVLFRAVPAYIGGPRAYYALHRESGMPIGRADMAIATPEPFLGFWNAVVREVRYFREYGKQVVVSTANPSARVVWIERLPFDSKARQPGA
jgi:hypothetical protein